MGKVLRFSQEAGKLVSDKMRSDRFVATCLRGSALDHCANWFAEPLPGLYEKRWNEVHDFCKKLERRFRVIQVAWDESKFENSRIERDEAGGAAADTEARAGSGAAFQPQEISQVLRDPMFEAYLHLVLEVNGTLVELSAWLERCPCHQHIQEKFRSYTPVATMRAEFGERLASQMHHGFVACPMRGKRAPELACGALMTILDRSCLRNLHNDTLKFQCWFKISDRTLLME